MHRARRTVERLHRSGGTREQITRGMAHTAQGELSNLFRIQQENGLAALSRSWGWDICPTPSLERKQEGSSEGESGKNR